MTSRCWSLALIAVAVWNAQGQAADLTARPPLDALAAIFAPADIRPQLGIGADLANFGHQLDARVDEEGDAIDHLA